MDHLACGLFIAAQVSFELLDGPRGLWFVYDGSRFI
jgi:hypothetical protein